MTKLSEKNIVILRENQLAALSVIVTGGTYGHAAKVAGVTERTINRWLNLPDFKKALSITTSNSVSIATARLARLSELAVNVLEAAMRDKENTTTSQRIRASNMVLGHLIKLAEMSDIQERISGLESRLDRLNSHSKSDTVIQGYN
mgnify:CR=1 FL=1